MSVAEIVADVRKRGDAALREWALRLDGVEPGRAEPADGLPEAEVLALAGRVRRWHELQRPADVRLEVEPGVELERRWLPLPSVGIYVPRGLVSTLVMCAVPARAAGVLRIVVVTPPAGAGLVAAAARLLGVEEVWAVGGAHADRRARVRHRDDRTRRQDRRPGQRVRERGEARSSRATSPSTCPRGRPRWRSCSGAAATAASRSSSSPRRPSTARTPSARSSTATTSKRRSPKWNGSLPSTSSCSARRSRSPGGSATPAPSSSARARRSPPATMRPAATTSCRPAAGRRSSGGLGLETFLKPVTVQRLTRGRARPRRARRCEALAAVEGMPAHAAAVER